MASSVAVAVLAATGATVASATQPYDSALSAMFASLHMELVDLEKTPLSSRSLGPTLAKAFTADSVLTMGPLSGVGKFFYNSSAQAWRNIYCLNETIFSPDGKVCNDQLASNNTESSSHLNMTVGLKSDAICKAFPSPYYDMLVPDLFRLFATRKGSKRVGGTDCEIWEATTPSATGNFSVSACIAADGVPREFNSSNGIAYKAASMQNWVFSNVSLLEIPADTFAPSHVCATDYPKPPCASSSVVTTDIYRLHSSSEPNSLQNRNAGDGLGDMGFFCALGGMDPSQLVTRWTVQANASWGQYAYCLYTAGQNMCFGSSGKQVGRESASGLGKGRVQGQCSENDDVGSWFSFPAEGACEDGAKVGDDGCTWAAQPVRTVSAGCILKDRGLEKACNEERGHAPLSRSAAIFEAALASNDPAKGGCPDVSEVQQQARMAGDIMVVV